MKTSYIVNRLLAMLLTVCVIASLAPAAIASDLPNAQELLIAEEYENTEAVKGSESLTWPEQIPQFSDIPSLYWGDNYILYVRNAGYMAGVGDNMFDPEGTLTKGQIITILASVAGVNLDTVTYPEPYQDVDGEWFAKPISWAHKNSLAQIIESSSDYFAPNSPLTRIKIAELLWKFAQYKGLASSTAPYVTLPSYTDIGGLTAAQINALKWCYYNKIMTGTSSTTFSPGTTVTRAQMAAICFAYDRCATKGYAFCVGTDYYDDAKVDTSDDAETARDYYYYLGYNVKCVTAPTVGVMLDSHNIRSNLLFFSGHGNSQCMVFRYKDSLNQVSKTGVYWERNYDSPADYHYVGIKGKMRLVDLAIFAGCETASGDDNLAKRACLNGAKVSIGWKKKVTAWPIDTQEDWLERFNRELAKGQSISDALREADDYIYLPFSDVKEWTAYYWDYNKFYSPGSLAPLKATEERLNSDYIEPEMMQKNLLSSYQGNVLIQQSDIAAETAAVIQTVEPCFHTEDYSVHIYEHGSESTTIDFVRVIGGFETVSGYTARVEGNRIVSIRDNTKALSKTAETRAIQISDRLGLSQQTEMRKETPDQPEIVTNALRLAQEQTQSSPDKEMVGQRYCYYYDIDQDKPYILVYTDYLFDGTGTMGVDLYLYELIDCEVAS